MQNHLSRSNFIGRAQESALRAWYGGLSSRSAVEQYLPDELITFTARAVISNIRKDLIAYARLCGHSDAATLLAHPESQRAKLSTKALNVIDSLRNAVLLEPEVTDDVSRWFGPRITTALHDFDVKTLSDLTVRIPRRKMWWLAINGLGKAGARQIETFFKLHPKLTNQARALIKVDRVDGAIAPWESFIVPYELCGAHGLYRSPDKVCGTDAKTDREAVNAWLLLFESEATIRSYRKEAERLMLWAILVRKKALSSLSVEDATAYRSFLKNPIPRVEWVGSPVSRNSAQWKPFTGPLSPKSVAYSLSVLNAMYCWLVAQGYNLINPFAGVKVRNAKEMKSIGVQNYFTAGEWNLIRAISEGLEWSHGWAESSAMRLRFCLDFAYATGLRVSELAAAQLGNIQKDSHDDYWLYVVGKGGKKAKVNLPPMVRLSLDRYLVYRGIPINSQQQDPATPLIASDLARNNLSATRLSAILKRFFELAGDQVGNDHPVLREKLGRASPHWLRHTHASHALASGVELTTVRDNLRHASVATTSIYLHTDDVKRAIQMAKAFS